MRSVSALALLLALAASPVAQDHEDHGSMDHGEMDHGRMDHAGHAGHGLRGV